MTLVDRAAGTAPLPPVRAGATNDHLAPWASVVLVAVVTSVIPILGVLAVSGSVPAGWPWWALTGPPLMGLAVLLSRVRVELSVVALGLAVAVLIPPFDTELAVTGVWPTVASAAMFLGLCWVTCSLGMQLPLRWSLVWLAGLVGAALWGLGADVPAALLGVGWWLVGQTFRYRQQVADRLQLRADELAGEQERYVAEAVRLERARIARELHDVVAHCMTVIVIQARAGQQLVSADSRATEEVLDAILASAREAEADVNALVAVMDPDQVRPLSRDLLDTMVERAAATGVRARLTVRGDPAELPAPVAEACHRVVQEALTNALRYAPGADVVIELDCTDDVVLIVENGIAAEPHLPGVGAGRGLEGLRERVSGLGGSAVWGTQPDGAWRLQVIVPLAPPVDASQPASRVA